MFQTMRCRAGTLPLTLLICMAACANRTPTDGLAADQAEKNAVAQTMRDWAHAYITHDQALLDRVRAPDWVYSGEPSGALITKPEADKTFQTDTSIHYTAFDDDDLNVRLYGSTAVVNARENIRWEAGGKPGSESYRVTAVFVKQQGQWRCVASHSSPITAK